MELVCLWISSTGESSILLLDLQEGCGLDLAGHGGVASIVRLPPRLYVQSFLSRYLCLI